MWHQIFPAFEVNYILMNLAYNQLKKTLVWSWTIARLCFSLTIIAPLKVAINNAVKASQ